MARSNASHEDDPEAIEPYSVFTTVEKWCIVITVSYAACFSTLSSFIYYPALPLLAQTLNVSIDQINLTVTSYMAVATIAPVLVGDAADILGRRPIYLTILSLYFVANLAIALSKSYTVLLVLRVLQALAISGTFSLAYGVVTDVASPAERGTFASVVSFAITVAPSIGPILGGALAFAAGWPWIFFFLCIASGSCLSIMVFFLPETSRNVVGNGSRKPPKHLRLPFPSLFCHWKETSATAGYQWRIPNPLRSLTILVRKDNTIIIVACGILYVIYTCLNTSLSILCIRIYGLNQWQAGLIYLPFGLGGVLSTLFSGRLMNGAYRKFRKARGLSTDRAVGDDLDAFPIEKARIGIIWVPMLLTTLSVVAFGWALDYHQHIAILLCLQFLAGLCMQLDFSIYNTLLVDKNHRAPAAAQASSNVVRCTLAAIIVAFQQDVFDAIGAGWTFTSLGGLCLFAIGLFFIDYRKGTSWRQSSLPPPPCEMRTVSR